jgi:hypothetical protein
MHLSVNRLAVHIAFIGLMLIPFSVLAQSDQTDVGSECAKNELIDWPFGKGVRTYFGAIEKSDRILFKEEVIDFFEASGSIEVVHRRHQVMKLGSENPYSRIVNLPFYAKDSIEQVVDLRGITHKADGNRVVLDTSFTRIIDLNDRYQSLEFVMPAADSGDVIEFAYSLRRRFIEELPDFMLQESVPVELAQLQINYPTFVRYAVQAVNTEELDLCFLRVQQDTSSIPPVFVYRRPPLKTVDYWIAKDVPALAEENLAGNLDDLKARLVMKMSEFGRPRQPLEISWEVVLAQYRKEQRIFRIKENWKQILPDSQKTEWLELNERDRILAVFHHINDNVRLERPLSGIPKFVDKIKDLPNEQWNQADVNLKLIAWLEAVSINAEIVVAPIESVGSMRIGFPSPFKLNSLIVFLKHQNKPVWLDASIPSSAPNLLRQANLSAEGILLRERSHEWIKTTASESLYGVEAAINASLSTTGELSGKMIARLRGYPAELYVEQLKKGESPKEVITQVFFNAYNEVNIDSVQVRTYYDESMARQIVIDANFSIPSYTWDFADALDFRPLVVGYRLQNPIKGGQRTLPIRLDAPEYIKLDFVIRLPSGKLVHDMQDFSQSSSLPSGFLLEKYTFKPTVLTYHFETLFSAREYDASLYDRVNEIYERWIELSNTRWRLEKR